MLCLEIYYIDQSSGSESFVLQFKSYCWVNFGRLDVEIWKVKSWRWLVLNLLIWRFFGSEDPTDYTGKNVSNLDILTDIQPCLSRLDFTQFISIIYFKNQCRKFIDLKLISEYFWYSLKYPNLSSVSRRILPPTKCHNHPQQKINFHS